MKKTIALIQGIISESWASTVWVSVMKACEEKKINLISFIGGVLNSPRGNHAKKNVIYDFFNKDMIDGSVIFTGSINYFTNDDDMYTFVKKYKPSPIVTLETSYKGISCIYHDSKRGMREIIAHLIEAHGRRKIAFIRGPEMHQIANERYETYLETLKEFGIPIDNSIISPPDDFANSVGMLEKIMENKNAKFDAVASVNDELILPVLHFLLEKGYRIPEDVAVVGYDNLHLAAITNPPLTSVKGPHQEMGKVSIDMLIKMMEGKAVTLKETLYGIPIIRESCGCESNSIKKLSFIKKMLSNTGDKKSKKTSSIDRIIQEAGNLSKLLEDDWAVKLKNSLFLELRHKKKKLFLPLLKSYISLTISNENNINLWQDVITELWKQTKSKFIIQPEKIKHLDIVIQKSRVLISEILLRSQMYNEYQSNKLKNTINEISQKLISTFDISKLMDILVSELPTIGIYNCYISVYEDNKTLKNSRLILAYNKKANENIFSKNIIFPSEELLPKEVFDELNEEEENYNLLVLPLLFFDEQIGYVVFGVGPLGSTIYETLSGQISSSLKGAFLVNKINTHSEILLRGIENLTVTLEEMVRNIESIFNNMLNQASAVDQGAAAIERIVQNISSTTQKSIEAKELSNDLNKTAHESDDTVKKSINTASKVEKESDNILQVVNLIKEISEKIRILSLNASIQASHIGDGVSGFSVVAHEIRALSDETKNNIKNIEKIVISIVKKISESVRFTEDAGASLTKIIDHSKRNVEIMEEMNSSMLEQNDKANEILNTMHELVNITHNVKKAMEEQKIATEEFNEALIKLRNSQ